MKKLKGIGGLLAIMLLISSLFGFALAEESGNEVFIYQYGDQNQAHLEQFGDGHYSFIYQEGNNNNATAGL